MPALLACALAASAAGSGPASAPAGGEEGLAVLVVFRRPPLGGARRLAAEAGGFVRHQFPEVGAVALQVAAGRADWLRRQPEVALVEPDPPRRALAAPQTSELKPTASNGLYGLVTTRAVNAHQRGVTGGGVVLCLADTGLDAGHPDLANYAGGIDLVDDDFDPDVGGAAELGAHGTHVAGTLAAALNGSGVRGVAPGAALYHARVLGADGGGRTSDVMAGVRHLVEERGCRVINLSLGGGTFSAVEERFYRQLWESDRALVVAAAGNDGGEGVLYPARYEGVVAVGAVDAQSRHADFSNTGEGLDLSAPGVGILSAVPRGSGSEATVSVRQTYGARAFEFSGQTAGVRGKLLSCGSGNTAAEFPPGVAGQIALVLRGGEFFSTKVENAMNAGALAVVVQNNVADDVTGTLQEPTASDGRPWVPAVLVALADGKLLRRQRGQATLVSTTTDWALFSGTSMASPHVAGVAALLFAVSPALTNAAAVALLEETAIDLGTPGYDPIHGWGLVDAAAATRAAVP